jgi:hypothetical protein
LPGTAHSLRENAADRHPSAHAFALDLAAAAAVALGPDWALRSGLRLRLDGSLRVSSGRVSPKHGGTAPSRDSRRPPDGDLPGEIEVQDRGDEAPVDDPTAMSGASTDVVSVSEPQPTSPGRRRRDGSGNPRRQSKPDAVSGGSPVGGRGPRIWRERSSPQKRLIAGSIGVLLLFVASFVALYPPTRTPPPGNFRSAWFCGFSAGPNNIASCVDIFRGTAKLNPDGSASPGESLVQGPGVALRGGVHGADWPLQIWKAFMDAALAGQPNQKFQPPAFAGAMASSTPEPNPLSSLFTGGR